MMPPALLYLACMFVASMGRNAYFVATVWLVLTEADSMAAVAVLLTLSAATEFLVSGPAGVVTDRWDRRQVCILSDVARIAIVLATAFALASGGGLYALYGSTIAYSIADRIYMTAIQSIIPSISPADRLVSFNAWSYFCMQSGNLVSAFAIGLLLYAVSQEAVLVSISACFLVSLLIMAWLRRTVLGTIPLRDHGGPGVSQWTFEMMDIWRLPWLRNLTIVYAQIYTSGMLINLLLSAYVLRELGGSSIEFGSLESGWAVGSIAANLLLTFHAFRNAQGTMLIPTLIVSGLSMLAFALPLGFLAAFLPVILLGAFYNSARVLIDVEIQRSVAYSHLGRVKGLVQAFCMGFGLLAYGAIALLGDTMMPSTIFVAYGGLMVLSGLLICRHAHAALPSSRKDAA